MAMFEVSLTIPDIEAHTAVEAIEQFRMALFQCELQFIAKEDDDKGTLHHVVFDPMTRRDIEGA